MPRIGEGDRRDVMTVVPWKRRPAFLPPTCVSTSDVSRLHPTTAGTPNRRCVSTCDFLLQPLRSLPSARSVPLTYILTVAHSSARFTAGSGCILERPSHTIIFRTILHHHLSCIQFALITFGYHGLPDEQCQLDVSALMRFIPPLFSSRLFVL
jgi:hypothetical protein